MNDTVIGVFFTIALTMIAVVIGIFWKQYKRLNKIEAVKQNLYELNELIKIITKNYPKNELENFVNIITKEINPSELILSLRVVSKFKDILEKQSEDLERVIKLSLQQFNEVSGKIHARIEENAKFYKRLDEKKQSKLYLMENILKSQSIRETLEFKDSIFIESGSTLAYLTLPIIKELPSIRNGRNITICTNNAIVYILLLFEENINALLLPGKPKNQYGATFGDAEESNVCNKTNVLKFLKDNNVLTIFSTTSELDIDYGPHVSSSANCVMKNALYEYVKKNKHVSNFVFITSEKINRNVNTNEFDGQCRLIFDEKARAISELSDNDKKDIGKLFRETLNEGRTYIVTASVEQSQCKNAVELIKNEYPHLTSWPSVGSNGRLEVIYKRNE